MHPYLKTDLVVASLGAFALETVELVHQGKIGHALPSAAQVVSVASSASSATPVMSFPSAITEWIYPNVADSEVLKNDGQTLPITLA